MYRLIYTSKVSKTISDAEFQQLCRSAAEYNASQFITGVLLFSGSEFLQCLEGPLDMVSELFKKISVDSRHHDVQVHSFELQPERWFGNWCMAGFIAQMNINNSIEQTAYSLLDQRLQHSWSSLGIGTVDLVREYAQVKAAVELAVS